MGKHYLKFFLELKTFYDTKLTKKSKLVKWNIKKILKNNRKIQKRKVRENSLNTWNIDPDNLNFT